MQDRASTPTPTEGSPEPYDKGVSPALPDRVAGAWPVAAWRDLRVAVAVSGGADSVALFCCLHALKAAAGGRGDLTVLHYDHRVRGERSSADAHWVEELAHQHGVRCVSESSPVSGARSEETLRDQRRAFFRRAADTLGVRYLATGHTADDQAETVLFRLLRGAGPRGAAGIRQSAPLSESCAVVRPLLGETRDDLTAYLAKIRQPHREDATNQDDAYARNWLRHRVLPVLAERFPDARSELTAFATRAAEAADLIESVAAVAADRAALPAPPDRVVLSVAALATEPPALVVEVLRLVWRRAGWPQRAMTAEHWRRLGEMASGPVPVEPIVFPGAVRVERSSDRLVLASPSPTDDETGSC